MTRRLVRAVRILAADGRIPWWLRGLAALGLLPVPGPFDEAVLLLVGAILYIFHRVSLSEAWEQARQSGEAAAAAAAIFDEGRRILLVLERERWSYPGGRLETGETPEAAAVREVREEVGVEVELGRRLVRREWPDGFVLHVFAAAILSGEPHAPQGVREVGWFEPDELPEPRSRALDTLPAVLTT
jgi:ADP-ribose pyrophosphatase YjhB (NUDIX family)